MDQLTAISLFNKVVETGSFSEAGRQSNLAPSSVSRRISDLEAWIGSTLFHRTTRQLNLTQAGEDFYTRTKDILIDFEAARASAAKREHYPSGHIRISLPASFARHFVSAASEFQMAWPEVSVNLTATDRNVDLIAEGFDLVIRAGELADSSLRAKPITSVNRYLCAAPSYFTNAPKLEKPGDLTTHNCLILGRNKTTSQWHFSGEKNSIAVTVSGTFSANSSDMLLAAAKQGQGLILSPEWVVGPDLLKGNLVKALPKYTVTPAKTTLYAVHAYKKYIPPKVQVFVDFLIEYFSADYDWQQH